MSINTASPKDTYDHTLGTGATQWGWWLKVDVRGVNDAGEISDDWQATLTVEDGVTGEDKVVTFGHKDVLAAARKIISDPPKWCSQALLRECSHLIFDADSTDFDANSADELLQVMCLGEIVYC